MNKKQKLKIRTIADWDMRKKARRLTKITPKFKRDRDDDQQKYFCDKPRGYHFGYNPNRVVINFYLSDFERSMISRDFHRYHERSKVYFDRWSMFTMSRQCDLGFRRKVNTKIELTEYDFVPV